MPETMVSASLEDYLEVIEEITSGGGVARMRDIAERMKVRTPSATAAVRRLGKMGMVTHERYEYVELTEVGREYAEGVVKRHGMLKRFLSEVLGVSGENAEEDACVMEHGLSTDTSERLMRLMEYLGERGLETLGWREWVEWRERSTEEKTEKEGEEGS